MSANKKPDKTFVKSIYYRNVYQISWFHGIFGKKQWNYAESKSSNLITYVQISMYVDLRKNWFDEKNKEVIFIQILNSSFVLL